MPDGLPTDLAEIIAAALHHDMCGDETYDGDLSVQLADRALHEDQAAAVLEALAGHDTAPPDGSLLGQLRAERARHQETLTRAEEAERGLAEAREEIEEDARVMQAWRRREAQAVGRAEQAEATIARVREIPRLPHTSERQEALGRAYTQGWESVISCIDAALTPPATEPVPTAPTRTP